MSSLKQTQNFLKLREKSKKKYDISIFSLLPKEIILQIICQAKKDHKYDVWLEDLKSNILYWKGASCRSRAVKDLRDWWDDRKARPTPESCWKVMLKSYVNTELLKKRKRHPAIKNKKN